MSRTVFPAGTREEPGRMRQHGNYILRDSACDHIITVGGEVPAQKHAVKRFLEAYELVNKADRTKAEEERLWKGERLRDKRGRFTGGRSVPMCVYLPEAYRTPMRENGRWNYKVMHALPVQFSREAQIKATRRFCESVTLHGRGVAIAAMHDLESHNPHVHIMFFDRDTKTGKSVQLLSEKSTVRQKKGLEPNATVYIRKMWEMDCNGTAAEHGYEVRIDHRSNLARGLEAGDQKRGWAVHALEEERDQETLTLDRATSSEIVVDRPAPETTVKGGEDTGHFIDWLDAASDEDEPPLPEMHEAADPVPQSAPPQHLEAPCPAVQESEEIPEPEPAPPQDLDDTGAPQTEEPEMADPTNTAAQAQREAEEDARADAPPAGDAWFEGGRPPKTLEERIAVAAGHNERLQRITGAEQAVRMATFDITEANGATAHKSYDLQQAQVEEAHIAEEATAADARAERMKDPYGYPPGSKMPNSRFVPKSWRGASDAKRAQFEEAQRVAAEKKTAYAVARGKTASAAAALRMHQDYLDGLERKRADDIVATEKAFGKAPQREAEKQLLKSQRDAIMGGRLGPHDLGPSITAEMIYEAWKLGGLADNLALEALKWMNDGVYLNVIQRAIEKSLKRGPLIDI